MIHMKKRFPFSVTGDGGERLRKIYSRLDLKEDIYSCCKTRKIGAYVFKRKRNLQYIGALDLDWSTVTLELNYVALTEHVNTTILIPNIHSELSLKTIYALLVMSKPSVR